MSGKNRILITGGTGYIGSHTVVEMVQAGFEVVILDNLSNSKLAVLDHIALITGEKPEFVQGDILDAPLLHALFEKYQFSGVIHFAGLKAVGESVSKPMKYYTDNMAGTINLLNVMFEHQCYKLVFSSSATVYGDPETVPIFESFPLSATNPYGRSKLMIEDMLRDLAHSDPKWQLTLLRYFNPVSAHSSGFLGEDPNGIPNNLMPYIAQVASGKLPRLSVFGGDYDTADGTGVRDYIHVVDLARAHVLAISNLSEDQGCVAYNVGTGCGYSVLQMVEAFMAASGVEIPYDIVARRAGDIATSYADASLAAQEIGWVAEYDLTRMMEDQWRWQQANPNGIKDSQS